MRPPDPAYPRAWFSAGSVCLAPRCVDEGVRTVSGAEALALHTAHLSGCLAARLRQDRTAFAYHDVWEQALRVAVKAAQAWRRAAA